MNKGTPCFSAKKQGVPLFVTLRRIAEDEMGVLFSAFPIFRGHVHQLIHVQNQLHYCAYLSYAKAK